MEQAAGRDDERREIALRVEAATPVEGLKRVEAVLAEVDPSARARLDPATGIVHIETTREALDITAALDRAGLAASAMTG